MRIDAIHSRFPEEGISISAARVAWGRESGDVRANSPGSTCGLILGVNALPRFPPPG
jgi:hypothetical protein